MFEKKIILTTSDLKEKYEIISIISSEISEEINYKDKKFNYYSK